jgi:hypothetical protein
LLPKLLTEAQPLRLWRPTADEDGHYTNFHYTKLHYGWLVFPGRAVGHRHMSATAILQNLPDAFISIASSLEPGRICMITTYSQIASSRPKPMLDACVAL